MFPNPLHPAVVHLPIALVGLLPLFATGALLAIHRGAPARRVWTLVVGLHALLAVCAWAAVETGEEQEEAVERVVAEQHIESHEEAAERFLVLAGIALGLSASGLLGGRSGKVGRVLGTASTALLLTAGIQVGNSGGDLVYKHGAARAYAIEGSSRAEHTWGNKGRGTAERDSRTTAVDREEND